jgi:uncharacterized protein (DUF885 family)
MSRSTLLAALLIILPGTLFATQSQVPEPITLDRQTGVLASMLQRFAADLRSVEHVHDIADGPRRAQAMRGFYRDWLDRLQAIRTEGLSTQDSIDRLLFERELQHRLAQLDFDAARFAEAAPLLPELPRLLDLLEARRALDYQDGRASAEVLETVRLALKKQHDAIDRDAAKAAPGVAPVVGNRAAGMLDHSRAALKAWHAFYADYDPGFTWWTKGPFEALDELMEDYATRLRERFAGMSEPEAIVGDPIGRDALMASLAYEMIPYTPEELVRLAENELVWIHGEMEKAARELGFEDWRAALEVVKTRHVAPGEQPRLVVEMAHEAVDFLRTRELVTIPELATRDWRMNMLSPEAQLQAPFFLGGQDVWVAFPTADMPLAKKLMSLRGNNRHFSRAVVHHELIPGHHLQHFMNQRYSTHRSPFRTPFWGEGWALYWEFRLYDLGFATTPEDKLGMLFWRAHRAARIQFSLGFHLGTMSPEQAIDLLVANGHERENATAEVRRSFAGDWPPIYQAAYMLGGLQFRALHRDLVANGKMSERDFHDRILQGGSMPVEMVRAMLLDQPPSAQFESSWRFYDMAPEPQKRGRR